MTKVKLMKRLRSQAGESIAEVLIATLIAALALMMLAVMISSTVKQVNTSKAAMEAYYAKNAALEQQTTGSSTVEITIKSTSQTGSEITMNVGDVKLYENTAFNNHVYAYQK